MHLLEQFLQTLLILIVFLYLDLDLFATARAFGACALELLLDLTGCDFVVAGGDVDGDEGLDLLLGELFHLELTGGEFLCAGLHFAGHCALLYYDGLLDHYLLALLCVGG